MAKIEFTESEMYIICNELGRCIDNLDEKLVCNKNYNDSVRGIIDKIQKNLKKN